MAQSLLSHAYFPWWPHLFSALYFFILCSHNSTLLPISEYSNLTSIPQGSFFCISFYNAVPIFTSVFLAPKTVRGTQLIYIEWRHAMSTWRNSPLTGPLVFHWTLVCNENCVYETQFALISQTYWDLIVRLTIYDSNWDSWRVKVVAKNI